MIVSYGAFIIDYPEFAETDRTTIERKLQQAERDTHYLVWGSKQRLGIMLLAAHYLACSPIGEQARLAKDNIKTVYSELREQQEQIVALGLNRTI
jgi:hypothetical protein